MLRRKQHKQQEYIDKVAVFRIRSFYTLREWYPSLE